MITLGDCVRLFSKPNSPLKKKNKLKCLMITLLHLVNVCQKVWGGLDH